jgi:hypothetical protein
MIFDIFSPKKIVEKKCAILAKKKSQQFRKKK